MKPKLLICFIIVLSHNTYSFSQGLWTQKADFGGGKRNGAIGFSIGDKGYIGTASGDTLIESFWKYDPSNDAWTQIADFAGPTRIHAVGFAIEKKGYISTGEHLNGTTITLLNDLWEWDQALNTWSEKTKMPATGRSSAVGLSIGTKGYIGTGSSGSAGLNDLWEWDQGTDSWSQKTSLPAAGLSRKYATGFSIGTKGYIGTGTTGNFLFNDFWEYDPSNDTWTQKAVFPGAPREFAVGLSIGTKGYIGLGGYTGGYNRDFWEWDQATDIWIQKTIFANSGRQCPVGFSIGGKGYVGTGMDSTLASQKDFWEFDPNENGIIEAELENSVSVYPNPSHGKFDLAINKLADLDVSNLEIFNVYGDKIYSLVNFHISASAYPHIDLSSQPKGVYFIHITCSKGAVVKKIVINR